MISFRTELENPVVEKDIIDLEKKIRKFYNLEIDEEKFRSLRLARGIYGQRQQGVQMIRIKVPYGKLTVNQFNRIADVSDEFSNGILHATTRQDIQIHYVSLDRTPELWSRLEQDQVTLREACGNTVRNITASAKSGIDPEEPFDVSPYAQKMFQYFLRNPICQEMGRKFKISFSSSENDSALSFIHDLGFIPKIQIENDVKTRGFKVMLGGGLGAQPHLAQTAFEFLNEDQLIPFTEALLRVFDRYGERARRHKARLKFLLSELSIEKLKLLVQEEKSGLLHQNISVDTTTNPLKLPDLNGLKNLNLSDDDQYNNWFATNVFEQKQRGYYGIFIKVPLGNISSETARKLAFISETYGADDIRITINQGFLLKYITRAGLPHVFLALKELNLADPGFDSPLDITACPGTDTCNLGISSSTGIAKIMEDMLAREYPGLMHNSEIKIKISGCPNSCGQHGIASIGFHGSSLKKEVKVLPALQVLLGGGVLANGEGRISDKVIKIPSKRGPDGLRTIFNDYESNRYQEERFADYYQRNGKMYFYQLLKPLADLSSVLSSDFIDWGREKEFKVETEVGECAGVIIDLVSTLLIEANEKLELSKESLEEGKYSDSTYHAYNAMIHSAKAMLLKKEITCNTQMKVIKEFDIHFRDISKLFDTGSFESAIMIIREKQSDNSFAIKYYNMAKGFIDTLKDYTIIEEPKYE